MPIKNHLDDIQANILKPHGRNYTWCVFLNFYRGQPLAEIRKWIKDFSKELTTAKQQLEDAAMRRNDNAYDGGMVTCVFLSNEFFRLLKLGDTLGKMDFAFVQGMKWKYNRTERRDVLNDPYFEEWEKKYQYDLDAMVLIADDSRAHLSEMWKKLNQELSIRNIGRILFTEAGYTLRQKDGLVKEHFGFADSVDPIHLLGRNDEPLEEICRQNIFEDTNKYGSYLVFRKYEQNVWLFNKKIRQLAERLGVNEEFAGAQIVGRFKNGLSLKHAPTITGPVDPASQPGLDLEGQRCPFHAHSRKANPINDVPDSHKYRMARRGVTYGLRQDGDEPSEGVGLLFMSYQRSVVDQFEALVQRWFNSSKFPENYLSKPEKPTGIDPLLGTSDGKVPQRWSRRWGSSTESDYFDFENDIQPVGNPVKFLGGEYFYAPPISFLKDLPHATTSLLKNESSLAGNKREGITYFQQISGRLGHHNLPI